MKKGFKGYKIVYVDSRKYKLTIQDLKHYGKRGLKDVIIWKLSKNPEYQDPHYTQEELENLGYDENDYYELDVHPYYRRDEYIATIYVSIGRTMTIQEALDLGIIRRL